MPRPLRIEYENAWYHVMNRGINRQDIFINTKHNEIFLQLLEEISIKFYVEIHSYCLMSNHYHLLIHTPLANLSRVMRYLDGLYTQRFNRSELRDGPLFRGRYKAILVESEPYLLELSRYIHLNPTPSITIDPFNYRWSSLQFYIQKNLGYSWLKTDLILSYMNKQNPEHAYIEFINQGISDEIKSFYDKKITPSILGSKEFTKKNLAKINKKYKIPYSPDIKHTTPKLTLETILKEVMNYFKIDKNKILKKTQGKKNYFREVTIYLAIQVGQMSHAKIGYLFELSNEGIGASLKRYRKLLLESNKAQVDLNNIIQNF